MQQQTSYSHLQTCKWILFVQMQPSTLMMHQLKVTVIDLTKSSQETPSGKKSKKAGYSKQQKEFAEKVPIIIGCRMRVFLDTKKEKMHATVITAETR